MKKETQQIEVWSDETNMAVVRMPGRNFPGLVVQGDKLISVAGAAKRVKDIADTTGSDELKREAGNLLFDLEELLADYSSVTSETED